MKPSSFAPAIGFILLAGCAAPKGVHHPGLSNDGYGYVKNGPTLPPPNGLISHMSFQESQSLKATPTPPTLPTPQVVTPTVTPPAKAAASENTEKAQTHRASTLPTQHASYKEPPKKPPVPKKTPPVKRPEIIDDNILPDGGVLSAKPLRHSHHSKHD